MSSEVSIANRALQKLGARRITSLTEDSVNARAVNACYSELRDAELRAHVWNFAKTRAQLAASATSPLFDKTNAFPLPSDCLRLLDNDPEKVVNWKDWLIEDNNILTDDDAPLNIRYIKQVTDPAQMDVLFREALASRIAYELAEELTQSNSKKQAAFADYQKAMNEARRTNAIENISQKPPEDEWITIRN